MQTNEILALLRISVCGLICVMFVACQSTPSSQRIHLVFSYGEGGVLQHEILDDVLHKFEQKHPHIKIHKHSVSGVSDIEKSFYLTSFASKSVFVDVFKADIIWISEFAAAGFLEPLDAYLSSDIKNQFVPNFLKSASYNEQLFALPYNISFGLLYYRSDLLKKYGFLPPTTFADLIKQARFIQEKENMMGYVWQGDVYEGLVCNFFEVYYNMGGKIHWQDLANETDAGNISETLSFDDEPLHRTLTFFYSALYDDDAISPASVRKSNEVDNVKAFQKGRAVFMRNWSSAYHYVMSGIPAEQFSIAPPPGQGIRLLGGAHLAMNQRSIHKKEAFLLMQYLTSSEIQAFLFNQRSHGPVIKAFYETKSNGANPIFSIEKLMRHTQTRPRSPYYQPLSKMIMTVMGQLLDQEITVDQAMQKMKNQAQRMEFGTHAKPDFPKTFYRWYR